MQNSYGTNLDLGQHEFEPVKIIQRSSSFLNNQLSSPGTIFPLILNICTRRRFVICCTSPQQLRTTFCLRREKIYMVTESMIHTCSIHCLNQGFLLGNPFDVDFDISECKPLKVNLASYHVGGIHKSLKKGAFLKNFGLLA